MVVAIRIGLSVLPLRVLKRVLTGLAYATPPEDAFRHSSTARIAWAVGGAREYLLKPSYLVQALSMWQRAKSSNGVETNG